MLARRSPAKGDLLTAGTADLGFVRVVAEDFFNFIGCDAVAFDRNMPIVAVGVVFQILED